MKKTPKDLARVDGLFLLPGAPHVVLLGLVSYGDDASSPSRRCPLLLVIEVLSYISI